MLRLTETRGSRSCPASFHASRNASMCRAWTTWNGSPLASSKTRVELIRFMPSPAAQDAVSAEAAPHQIRSRRPGECGSSRKQPGWVGEHRLRARLGEPLAAQQVEEHLRVAARHIGVGLPLSGLVAEVAPAVDYLLGRAAADPELQPAAREQVGGTGVLGHVQRVLVAHVDDRGAELDPRRSCAGRGEQGERRRQLRRVVVDAEVRAVGAYLLGRHRELHRLQQRVRRRDHPRARRRPPVAERQEPDLLHAPILADGAGCLRHVPGAPGRSVRRLGWPDARLVSAGAGTAVLRPAAGDARAAAHRRDQRSGPRRAAPPRTLRPRRPRLLRRVRVDVPRAPRRPSAVRASPLGRPPRPADEPSSRRRRRRR